MQKRTRRALFWVATLVFASASIVAIRYAQGEVFDWTTRTFVRTGAIAITVNTDANLYVNDVLTGSTSLLRKRIGAERLTPGQYSIRVLRDGYSVWRKTADVSAGMLTDFPSVLLLPTDEEAIPALRAEASASFADTTTLSRASPLPAPKGPTRPPRTVTRAGFNLTGTVLTDVSTASPSVIAEQVLGFSVDDNRSRVVWWTRNEVWVRWLRNTDYQPYYAEGQQQLITRFSSPVTNVGWFRGVDHLVVDLGPQGYRVVEVDTRGGINIVRF